jgi:FkbM family methyltransferase
VKHELRGRGWRILDPPFDFLGRATLEILFRSPLEFQEKALYGTPGLSERLQKALQWFLGGKRSVQIEFTEGLLSGCVLECFSSEKYFLLGSCYEHSVQARLREIVQVGDTVYDVGAHAGYMTLLLANLGGRGGRVFSFEPSPINFRRLKRTVEMNGVSNITVLNLAVSDREGVGLLSERGSESFVMHGEAESSEPSSQISTVCLDDFVSRDNHTPPNLLKIDVEGHAGRVLEGARRVLRFRRPIVLYEVHNPQEQAWVCEILRSESYQIADVDKERAFPSAKIAVPL